MPSTDSWAALPRHSARCICRRCRDARRREAWRPAAPERVVSDEAAAHIHQLIRLGWTQVQIAHVTGLATGTISTGRSAASSSTPRLPSASTRCSRGSRGDEDRGHPRSDTRRVGTRSCSVCPEVAGVPGAHTLSPLRPTARSSNPSAVARWPGRDSLHVPDSRCGRLWISAARSREWLKSSLSLSRGSA